MEEIYETSYIPPPPQQSTPQGVGFEGFPGPPRESSTPLSSQLKESTIVFCSVESRPKGEEPLAETPNSMASPIHELAEKQAQEGEYQPNGFEGFPGSPHESTIVHLSDKSRPEDEESLAETTNSMASPIHEPAEKRAQESKFKMSKQSRKSLRRARKLIQDFDEMSISTVETTLDTTVSAKEPDHKRQRSELTKGNLLGAPTAAPLSKSGKANEAKPASKPKGRQLSPPAGSSLEPQREAPAVSYSSRAAGGKPLMVTLRGSEEPLGEEHVIRVKALIDRNIILAAGLDYPIRILSVAVKGCKVRVSCENQQTHAWVKATINGKESDFIARSPDEIPPQKRFWFRMYQGFEASSIHKLLKACNAGFPEGKLHIKWCTADSKGINITVAVEPEMLGYLRERNFHLHCGSTVVPFRESKNRTTASRRLAKQARSSTSQAAEVKAKAAKGSVTPKDGKPTVASAGAEASEPPGSGATAQADAALPVEAAKAEVSGPAGSGVAAQAAPTITSEAALADAPGPSGSGTSAQAVSKTPPSPAHSFPLPPPGADKAGSALLHSSVELAEDANGDLTSPPPLFRGEASSPQDRLATPIPRLTRVA